MANPQGAIHSRLQSLLGASEPTEPQQAAPPAEQASEPAETPEPEQAGDTKQESRRVKAKLDDKEIELEVLTDGIDLDLVPKGLMMEADYRKKTSKLSEERKAFEAEKQSQLSEIEQMLYAEATLLDSEEGEQLRENDPEEYYRQRAKLEKRAQKLQQQRDKLNESLKFQQQAAIEAERKAWKQHITEWLDDAVMEADFKRMAKTMKSEGFSDADLEGIYDRRLLSLVRKAALYDELSNAPVENKRTKQAPRAQAPGGGEAPPQRKTTARDRLKKTGKRSDAQGAIKELLGL